MPELFLQTPEVCLQITQGRFLSRSLSWLMNVETTILRMSSGFSGLAVETAETAVNP